MVRSTRAGPSTQQYHRPTQTQRGSRRQVESASEEEEEEEEAEEEVVNEQPDHVGSGDEMDVDGGNNEISQKVNDLVRLALFMEYRRAPLKRDDINKKVLGPRARAFNIVFATAQQKLRDAFGMELVELPSRTELEQDGGHGHGTQSLGQTQDGPIATGIKKRANAAGSKTYMLRSCLSPLVIEHASQTLPKVLEEEGGDQGMLFPATVETDEDEDQGDADGTPKFYGSLISWSRADQLGSIGILYVILALVLANHRVMSDADLRRHLKSLRLTSNPALHVVKFDMSSTVGSVNLDTYLSTLLKQGYLDRLQVGVDANRKGKRGGGVGSKRLRTQAEDLEEGRMYEWRWGPRAHCEVGERNVGRFVAEFMVESAEEEDGRVGPQRQEELMKRMYAGFEKAAGGSLATLK